MEFPLEEAISVGELIRLKVEEEIRRRAAMGALDGLGREYQDVEAIRLRRPVDPPAEVLKAQQAFAAGHFLILVNGRRYTQLDEQVTLTPKTTVKFIRLMPLTGG